MVDVVVADVRPVQGSEYPLVLLRPAEDDGPYAGKVLPISVGTAEAQAIALALHERETPRPMTHDLFVQALGACNVEVVAVKIVSRRQRVFYAELHLESGGVARVLSCRPSDGIALALRCGAPLSVAEQVMTESSVEDPDAEGTEEDSETVIEEFKGFLDEISPDDFR
jgi:uncharacterized protein